MANTGQRTTASHASHQAVASCSGGLTRVINGSSICHQPNCAFNVDANMGHAFGMFMAHVGTLRTSCFGAS
jgi:hypothetical protein